MSHVSDLLQSARYTDASTPAQYDERARLLVRAIAQDIANGTPPETAIADGMVLSGKSAQVSLIKPDAMYTLLSDDVKRKVTQDTFKRVLKSYRYDADDEQGKQARARAYMISQGMDVSLLDITPATVTQTRTEINPDEMTDDHKVALLVKLGMSKQDAQKTIKGQSKNAQP
jgi:hypothetical protein